MVNPTLESSQVLTVEGVKADKGKTSVILYSDDYTEKVYTFLNDNNFQTIQTNPTDIFQKLLTKTLQQCNLIINKKKLLNSSEGCWGV